MAYLTEQNLANTLDIPVALPSVELNQGDWIVVATVRVTTPMRLTLRSMCLHVLGSTVDPAAVVPDNKVIPALGSVYVGLYQNYSASSPSTIVSLDVLSANAIGVFTRPTSALVITTPGYYSVLAVNNTKSSTQGTIDPATLINFKLLVTGQIRLELEV